MTKPLHLPADWRFAHPQAELLGGINVKSLLQSPTLLELLGQVAGRLQIHSVDWDSVLAKTNGVEQIWVSVRSGDALLLWQGKLDMPQNFAKLKNGMISYRISDTAVLMGKEASVLAAVQRLKGPLATEPAAASRIKNLSAENQLWFTGTQALVKQAKPSPVTVDLTGFSLGMQFRDGFRLETILKYANPASARRGMAASQNHQPLPNASIKLDTQLEGNSVRFTLAIDKAHLFQAVEKAMTSPAGQRLLAMAAAARKPGTAAGAAMATPSRAIEIQGLPKAAGQAQSPAEAGTAPAPPSTKLDGGITIQGGSYGSSRR
jgi:hypothetical protein